jgi:23S rRNA pseudouridine1911/1915/1917 synthase
MNRILTYEITEQDASQTIEQYLKRKGYSSQCIKELKKMPESILLDGRWEYMRTILNAGNILTVHVQEEASSEKIPPVEMALDIVYEDEDIMVINKPADMPIHPSLNNYYNSLANGLARYFEKQNKPFIFRCVNRLDKDTSGLTIIAKHMLSGGILSSMVADREIHREYRAIVCGQITPGEGTIDAPIARVGDSIIERCVDFEKGECAITHYRTVTYQNGHSLLSIHLETGRTHQIRVHMKHIGFPLVGDYLYNPDMKYIKRQALHSYRLQFTHPITGEFMDFTAPLPADMESVLVPSY